MYELVKAIICLKMAKLSDLLQLFGITLLIWDGSQTL